MRDVVNISVLCGGDLYKGYSVSVIIPALNEKDAIGKVLSHIPMMIADNIIVADNGSTDGTAEIARDHGARVISEPVKGYGRACKAGLEHAADADIIVFMDGDNSDYPEEMYLLLEKIHEGYDLVIGSRELGVQQQGSMKFHQRSGNRMIVALIDYLWNYRYTDLGPFRAIKSDALKKLGMTDDNYGWTVEMQVKALKQGLKICEVPVSYRKRIGRSKVSGTIAGSARAACKILFTIMKLRFNHSQ